MSQPKVIVFDFDGVIMDSNEISRLEFYKVFQSASDSAYKEVLCGNYHDEIEKLAGSRIKENPEQKEARLLLYAERKLSCPIFNGMKEILKELSEAGFVIAMNTSARERTCVPNLKYHGIYEYFDYIGHLEIARSKVEKFNIMKEKYGVTGEEMMFITDTVGDIREAKEAGVPTIAVTWGIHDREYFTMEKHDNLLAIVDSVEGLREKILK